MTPLQLILILCAYMLVLMVAIYCTKPTMRRIGGALASGAVGGCLPVTPLITLWDGVIPVLRTYNEKELNQMILQLRNNERFNWEVGINKGRQSDILYLLGIPKK